MSAAPAWRKSEDSRGCRPSLTLHILFFEAGLHCVSHYILKFAVPGALGDFSLYPPSPHRTARIRGSCYSPSFLYDIWGFKLRLCILVQTFHISFCVCVWVHSCVQEHMCVEARGQFLVFLRSHPPCVLKGLSLRPRAREPQSPSLAPPHSAGITGTHHQA